jgi:hypothetical protein
MSERKLMATEEIVVEPQNHSNQQERSIMASSSEPVKHLEQHMLEMDQDEDAIIAKAYPWGDKNADIEIQAMWPGAPSLMRWTREKNSMGGTNSQLQHAANAASGQPSRYEFTSDESSRGGSKFGGNKGQCGGNKEGCGLGSHSAPKAKKEKTQANYLAYCASDAGKDNFANRDINTAPAHYRELFELNPPLYFMNASGSNKARIAPKKKQSKKKQSKKKQSKT